MKLNEINVPKNKWPLDRDGNLDCVKKNLRSLKGAPEIVKGYFDCSMNPIKSLIGGPRLVGGFFSCAETLLTTLEGAPSVVGRQVYLFNMPNLLSLHNVHRFMKEINGGFYFPQSAGLIVTHLLGLCLIKGITEIETGEDVINDIFLRTYPDINLFQEALLEAGFTEQAKL